MTAGNPTPDTPCARPGGNQTPNDAAAAQPRLKTPACAVCGEPILRKGFVCVDISAAFKRRHQLGEIHARRRQLGDAAALQMPAPQLAPWRWFHTDCYRGSFKNVYVVGVGSLGSWRQVVHQLLRASLHQAWITHTAWQEMAGELLQLNPPGGD